MRILFQAAEPARSWPNDGGVSELERPLPRALAALGHDVRVAAPKPSRIDRTLPRAQPITRVTVPHVGGAQTARVEALPSGNVTQYLIGGMPITRGPAGARAAFFSLASIGLCRALDWRPDIVHAVDALAGPAVYWLAAARPEDEFFKRTATIFTIGDLADAWAGTPAELMAYGMAPSDAAWLPDWARASLTGLAIAHADWLSTDGPTRARELLTADFGAGLEGLLAARRDALAGILDGLDLEAWDPARDRALAARYDDATLERRARNKRELQRALGLTRAADTPLLAVPVLGEGEVMLAAVAQLLADPTPVGAIQVAFLGSRSPAMVRAVRALARQHAGQVAVARELGVDIVRRVMGGADLVLVDEPGQTGGLAHRVALRYGAVPVARRTGSVADLVEEGGQRGNGFEFADYNAASLLAAVRRALRAYQQPARWQALERRGMRQARKWGWDRAAHAYLALYQQALVQREEP